MSHLFTLVRPPDGRFRLARMCRHGGSRDRSGRTSEPVAVAAAGVLREPLCLIVGALYLPFIHLYGIWLFGALAGALIAIGGVAIFWVPALRAPSGWIGAAILLLFAVPLFLAPVGSSPRAHERTDPHDIRSGFSNRPGR